MKYLATAIIMAAAALLILNGHQTDGVVFTTIAVLISIFGKSRQPVITVVTRNGGIG